jgi:hypothetical protein
MNGRYICYLLLLPLLVLPLTALSQEEERFHMVMKIEDDPNVLMAGGDPDNIPFKVTNITTSMKDYQGKAVHNDLE